MLGVAIVLGIVSAAISIAAIRYVYPRLRFKGGFWTMMVLMGLGICSNFTKDYELVRGNDASTQWL
jgi:hypothetical protein